MRPEAIQPSLPELHIDRIADEGGMVALADAWNAVAQRADPASVFLFHEWFCAAWAWRREDAKLHILTVRDAGELVGILPLVRERSTRSLALLTVPDTQLCDLIVEPARAREVSAALAKALVADRSWDALHLHYLPVAGAIARTLAPELARCGMPSSNDDAGRNACIALDGTWDDYYSSRTRSLKKANNLAANRLAKAGTVRIAHFGPGDEDPAAYGAILDAVIDVSRRSWKQTTGNSLDQPGPGGFIRALSDSARNRQWLSLWLLYLDERPVAMEYQIIYSGNVHALRADFDAECIEISPGTHLFRHLLQSLFGQGQRRYFMGPGDNAYKARWTDEGEPLCKITIYNRTARGTLRWLWEVQLKPRARRIRDRLVRDRPP